MKELLDTYAREIARDPGNPDPYLRLGDVLHGMERFDDALAVYDRLLVLMPDCGPAHHNRANTLLEMGRWEDAIRGYRNALSHMPGFVEAYVTIATALQALGKPFEAMASCHRALAIDPECAEAHWNLALALLQVGEYAQGWEEFEWRWKKRGYPSKVRNFSQPAWNGAPLSGRTILVHCEQGFGDSLQFARFLPLVAEHGADGGHVFALQGEPDPESRIVAGPNIVEETDLVFVAFDENCFRGRAVRRLELDERVQERFGI